MVSVTAPCRRLNMQLIRRFKKYFTTIDDGKRFWVLYEMTGKEFLLLVGEMESSQFPLGVSTKSISMFKCSVILMILIYQNDIAYPYCAN